MAQQKKIAVLVSGGGTNLQALIDAEKRGELGNGKITLVIASKPGVYALERAANAGIEGRVLARKDYESIAAYSKALADEMTAAGIDLVVLAGFLTIIDEQVYEAFPNKIINVHPALIPSFCGKGFYGLHVHEAALAKGVKVSGATVHIVTPAYKTSAFPWSFREDGLVLRLQPSLPPEPLSSSEISDYVQSRQREQRQMRLSWN